MMLAVRQIWVYVKLVAIIAVVGLVLLIVGKNWSNEASIWFFGEDTKVNVLYLILITAVSSIVGWSLVRRVFGVLRELREVRESRRLQAQMEEQRRLAEQVAEREKRIDEKIRRQITEEA